MSGKPAPAGGHGEMMSKPEMDALRTRTPVAKAEPVKTPGKRAQTPPKYAPGHGPHSGGNNPPWQRTPPWNQPKPK